MSGHGPTHPVEDLEVLAGSVHHDEQIRLHQPGEGRQVQFKGIDEGEAALPGHLDQGDPGEVGLLTVELGVDRYACPVREGRDQVVELRLVRQWAESRIGSPVQAGLPESVGRSASTHAVVPPVTLTASRPSVMRNSAASRLRPPLAQIT